MSTPAPTTAPTTAPTLGDLYKSKGKTLHNANVAVATQALSAMPASIIQDVNSYQEGTITSAQLTQLMNTLSTYAKANNVGIAFYNEAKQPEIAVTAEGTAFTSTDDDDKKITQVYSAEQTPGYRMANSTENEPARVELIKARVVAFFNTRTAMIDAADTDVQDLGEESASKHVPKKRSGTIYTSIDPFELRYRNPFSATTTTTNYTPVVVKTPKDLGNGYVLVARQS